MSESSCNAQVRVSGSGRRVCRLRPFLSSSFRLGLIPRSDVGVSHRWSPPHCPETVQHGPSTRAEIQSIGSVRRGSVRMALRAQRVGVAVSGDAQDESAELEQLRKAMKTRPIIDKAMGVLMAAYSLASDDAWKTLVNVSQKTNTKLHTVAEEIVATTQEDVVDGRLRRLIEAAMSDLKSK